MKNQDTALIVTVSLKDHFLRAVMDAANNQNIPLSGPVKNHLADILVRFTETNALYKEAEDGKPQREPLAFMFGRAMQTEGKRRIEALRELGDTALFTAGFFPDLFRRKPVDVDYCVNMGRSAYESLSAMHDEDAVYGRGNGPYAELAEKFVDCADILAEIGDAYRPSAESDLPRAREVWEKTGSKRLKALLVRNGLLPSIP